MTEPREANSYWLGATHDDECERNAELVALLLIFMQPMTLPCTLIGAMYDQNPLGRGHLAEDGAAGELQIHAPLHASRGMKTPPARGRCC